MPRTGQEHGAAAGDVCTRQPLDGAQDYFSGGTGMSVPAARQKALVDRQSRQNWAAQGLKSSEFAASKNLGHRDADQAISEPGFADLSYRRIF